MFLVEDSSLSVTLGESMFSKKFKAFDPIVREIRGDQMRRTAMGCRTAPHRR